MLQWRVVVRVTSMSTARACCNDLVPIIALIVAFLASLPLGQSVNPQNSSIAGTMKTDRPNVLILFADDMGYGDLSCNGHPTIATPNIDRIAAEGMRFTQWYSGFHVCSPSRASMLTGRLPVRSGTAGSSWVGGVFRSTAVGGLPENETTFASLLKGVGYRTLAVGKWHVGQRRQFLPTSHGFDEYFGIPYSVDMGNSAWAPIYGKLQAPLPLLHNETVVEQPVNLNTLEARYVQKVKEFVNATTSARQPFLVYLAWSHVHVPNFVAPNYCNSSLRGRFGDAVQEMDAHIGDVMAYLHSIGVDKNTLVFFTSDNGPWRIQGLNGGSPGGFFEGKTTTWEGGIRVPGIARWPGRISAGVVSREVVATYDIFATIVSLAGARLPADRHIDGRDLSGVLFHGQPSPHQCLFHYKGTPSSGLPPHPDDPKPGLWAVRCGAYKAHFVTSCAVMQKWGDTRCTGKVVTEEDVLQDPELCQSTDECSLWLGSRPVIHSKPLLFNVEHDPSEFYPLTPHSEEYKSALVAILKARKEHEATLVPVPNQMALGSEFALRVCCSKPFCKCNPENYHPTEGKCTPVYPPAVTDSIGKQQDDAVFRV
mmetsp:Transcript_105019/g.203382  ORF Transcript_105019/g.203382 Transcript_105019/m.203382 type:complete len:594 (-) Transcript_105019:78-1859(-)